MQKHDWDRKETWQTCLATGKIKHQKGCAEIQKSECEFNDNSARHRTTYVKTSARKARVLFKKCKNMNREPTRLKYSAFKHIAILISSLAHHSVSCTFFFFLHVPFSKI